MLRHDAHTDYEVLHEHAQEDEDFRGLDFPLPVQGNQSPNMLALAMIVKISFGFGIFMLVIRLIGLSYPDVALVLSYIFTAAFAIALAIKWFAPERGMMEWPVWLGAAVVMLVASNRWVPGSILSAPLPDGSGNQPLIPIMFQAGIVLVIIVILLLPSVKNLLSTKTRGPLALGAIGCLVGGRCAALGYAPESDFGAWTFLAMMLAVVWWATVAITDQYVRFEHATNLSQTGAAGCGLPKCLAIFPVHQSMLGALAFPVSLWVGNLAFLATLHLRHANELGLFAFVVSLAGFLTLGSMFRSGGPNPFIAAWNALSFWLVYNLQRNANPNVFQCLPWFREPLMRFGVVGAGITVLSVSLLHLSGIHAPRGWNKDNPDDLPSAFWRHATPQGYPQVFEKCGLSNDAKAIYDRHVDELAKHGDAALPPRKPVRTFGDLLFSAFLFFVGGPVLFFFLLVATQGNYIAAQMARPEQVVDDESGTDAGKGNQAPYLRM